MDLFSLSLFALALFVNTASPGPSIAALVARVISHGARDVLPFIAAFWVGEVLWLTVALAGLTAVAQSFHELFLVLKYCGIAYLIWLAIALWRRPVTGATETLPPRAAPLKMFAAGMALTIGNPKIMVFYLALLPTLIDMSAVSFSLWAALAAITLGCIMIVDLGWLLLAHHARALLKTPPMVRLANRISALTLGGAAAVIASR